ncbi:MAG: hypothetical protein PHU51_01930 [Candidatus Nanoarchaeia archaeon]|nr:hypothetical protein [Candidatus Nanoarchaeia archaeon]
MMLKMLNQLLIKEIKEPIFDIIIYGSGVKGKRNPNDWDILIIFSDLKLKERLELVQKIKNNIKDKLEINLDFKQILLTELFSSSFLARSGIFFGGLSVKKNSSFAQTLGLNAFSLFTYDLNGLNHTEKVKFNYVLAGRNKKGMIEELEGLRLVNGAVKIPLKNSLVFEEILNNYKINFVKKNILEEV